MDTNILGIKELQNNLKRVADAAQKGQSFTVVRDSKPVFRIEPIQTAKKKGGINEFIAAASFSSNDKSLSTKIDEIVYGDTR